jgi:CSLREA domain-containing protein
VGAALAAPAATLSVTTLEDDGPGSLRRVVQEASSGDTIDFALTGKISLSSGPITIDKDITIIGPGARLLAISGGGLSRVFEVQPSSVTLSGVSVTDGMGPLRSQGGGILNRGELVMEQCVVASNSVPENFSGTSLGGGIFSEGSLTVRASTFVGNGAGLGGGIYNAGALSVENSTFSGNQAQSANWGGVGGAIRNAAGARAEINHCTVYGNGARAAGGIGNEANGIVTIRNSLVAGNYYTLSGSPDVGGSFSSHGHNLIGAVDGSEGLTNGVQQDLVGTFAAPLLPKLGPLLDNGGTTPTHALRLDSPAVDRGNAGGLTVDQRGKPRVFNFGGAPDAEDGADIGAFELDDTVPSGREVLVASLEDDGPGSLRQALRDAQRYDTITFAVAGVISLTNGELTVGTDLVIKGPGAQALTISAAGLSRVLQVASGVVSISGLTLADGFNNLTHGGGIVNLDTLSLTECVISNNLTADTFVTTSGEGGGIYNQASLKLTRCSVVGNRATGGGAIVNNGTLEMERCTVAGNAAGTAHFAGYCAGVINRGIATIRHCTVAGNTSDSSVGGIASAGTTRLFSTIVAGNWPSDCDGPIFSEGFNLIGAADGSIGLTNGLYQDLVGLRNSPLDARLGPLQDNGGPTPTQALLLGSPAIDRGSGGGGSRDQRGMPGAIEFPAYTNALDNTDIGAFELQESTQTDSTLIVNTLDDADDGMPGIAHCSLREAIAAANGSPTPARILFEPGVPGVVPPLHGVLTLTNGQLFISHSMELAGPTNRSIVLSGNHISRLLAVSHSATGMVLISHLTFTAGQAGGENGGAIFNESNLKLERCTLATNTAASGGAVWTATHGTLLLDHSTLSGNWASRHGGALACQGGTNILGHCTLYANSAELGGGIHNQGGSVVVRNTVVAGNTATGSGPDIVGGVWSDDFNLIGNDNGMSLSGAIKHTLTNVDPGLTPLADNGGPTWTHLPGPGSLLVDAGSADGATLDQRGLHRIADMAGTVNLVDGADIGAVEYDVIQTGPTFLVNAQDDSDDGFATIGHCSLREAMLAAEANPDPNTIAFATNVAGAIRLASPLPVVSTPLVVTGPGAARLAIQRGSEAEYRILTITSNGNARIAGLTIRGGFFNDVAGPGGGVFNAGSLEIRDCAIQENRGYRGAGVYNRGILAIQDSVVNGNGCSHDGEGGGIFNAGTLALNGVTVIGNAAGNDLSNGGGLYNAGGRMGITNCTITANLALGEGAGGGIYNTGDGVIGLSETTVNANAAFAGGGLLNEGGSVIAERCTFSGNSAPEDDGGGLWNIGELLLASCTISGNNSDFQGGGLYASGTVTLLSCTVANNFAYDGGGICGTAIVRNTITAANQTHTPQGRGPDWFGTLVSSNYNLIQNTNDCEIVGETARNLIGLDAKLGPLVNNGGATLTHALLAGSPAIDQGSPDSPVSDQRRFPRPVDQWDVADAAEGNGTDMGSFEVSDPDTDADGMPDSYERAYGFSPELAADAKEDADDDGQTNLSEFLGGTKPRDAQSVFRLANLQVRETSVVLSFTSVPGKSYRVEVAGQLNPAAWTTLAEAVPGTGQIVEFVDQEAVGQPLRFYRVRVR